MFDNLDTALIQALGFFTIFVFFVYQTLFADKESKNPKINPTKTKISDTNKSIKKESKKGLFKRKSKPVEEELPVKKKDCLIEIKKSIKKKLK